MKKFNISVCSTIKILHELRLFASDFVRKKERRGSSWCLGSAVPADIVALFLSNFGKLSNSQMAKSRNFRRICRRCPCRSMFIDRRVRIIGSSSVYVTRWRLTCPRRLFQDALVHLYLKRSSLIILYFISPRYRASLLPGPFYAREHTSGCLCLRILPRDEISTFVAVVSARCHVSRKWPAIRHRSSWWNEIPSAISDRMPRGIRNRPF